MPLNETSGIYFKDVFAPALIERTKEIASAPANHPEMIWILLPLLATLLFMEFYFGRYRDEELGWNTALGNSLVLVFVGLDLLRRLYGERFFATVNLQTIIILSPAAVLAFIILGIGILMILVNFFHMLPKEFAYVMSSPLAVNLTSFLAIVIVYSNIQIDILSMIASLAIFVCSVLFIDLIHLIEPHRNMEQKTNVGKLVTTIQGLAKQP